MRACHRRIAMFTQEHVCCYLRQEKNFPATLAASSYSGPRGKQHLDQVPGSWLFTYNILNTKPRLLQIFHIFYHMFLQPSET